MTSLCASFLKAKGERVRGGREGDNAEGGVYSAREGFFVSFEFLHFIILLCKELIFIFLSTLSLTPLILMIALHISGLRIIGEIQFHDAVLYSLKLKVRYLSDCIYL